MKIGTITIATGKNLNNLIRKVHTAGKEFQDTVHRAMISSMYAVVQEIDDGNPPNVNRFRSILLNMPNGTRRKAAGNWLRKMAPVQVSFKGKEVAVTMLKGKAAKKHPGFQLEHAAVNPYWDVEREERDPVPFDWQRSVQTLMRNIEAGIKGERPLKGDREMAQRVLSGIHNTVDDLLEA